MRYHQVRSLSARPVSSIVRPQRCEGLMTPVVLLVLPFLLWALAAFELLVRREYTAHRNHRVRDGRPPGLVWRPPAADRSGWRARTGWTLVRERTMVVWLLRTPQWVSDDSGAFRLLRWYRISSQSGTRARRPRSQRSGVRGEAEPNSAADRVAAGPVLRRRRQRGVG
jgi:hypothetical protein